MTNNEIDSATKALKAWFQSQEIDPGDAGIIMIKLTAELFVHKTKDLQQLQHAVNSTNLLLSVEIAGYLRP